MQRPLSRDRLRETDWIKLFKTKKANFEIMDKIILKNMVDFERKNICTGSSLRHGAMVYVNTYTFTVSPTILVGEQVVGGYQVQSSVVMTEHYLIMMIPGTTSSVVITEHDLIIMISGAVNSFKN